MAAALRHRGPDEFGLYRDRRAALAHTRLVDHRPRTGQQPLRTRIAPSGSSSTARSSTTLSCAPSSEQSGHRFYTHSDTEVLVHLYEERGPEFVHALNGQFAIALWDCGSRGSCSYGTGPASRPFYGASTRAPALRQRGQGPLAGVARLPARLDRVGLDAAHDLLGPVAPATVFEGVLEVSPGHISSSTRAAMERRYWESPSPAARLRAVRGAAQRGELHDLLARRDAAAGLRSDVPVGSYLSGGLDSSVVAALGSQRNGRAAAHVLAGFEDASTTRARSSGDGRPLQRPRP